MLFYSSRIQAIARLVQVQSTVPSTVLSCCSSKGLQCENCLGLQLCENEPVQPIEGFITLRKCVLQHLSCSLLVVEAVEKLIEDGCTSVVTCQDILRCVSTFILSLNMNPTQLPLVDDLIEKTLLSLLLNSTATVSRSHGPDISFTAFVEKIFIAIEANGDEMIKLSDYVAQDTNTSDESGCNGSGGNGSPVGESRNKIVSATVTNSDSVLPLSFPSILPTSASPTSTPLPDPDLDADNDTVDGLRENIDTLISIPKPLSISRMDSGWESTTAEATLASVRIEAAPRASVGIEHTSNEFNKLIQKVISTLNVDESAAALLLSIKHWDPKVVIESYLADPRAVRKRAGLSAHSGPSLVRYDQCCIPFENNCGAASPKLKTSVLGGGSTFSDEKSTVDKNYPTEIRCSIGLHNVSPQEMFALPCKHWFCSECLEGYISCSVRDNSWKIPCPQGEGCPYFITLDTVDRLCGPSIAACARQNLLK